jgi:thymidylate synthase (FAD)
MKIIQQSVKLFRPKPAKELYESIENAGRYSWRSPSEPDKIEAFIKRLIERGHESVLEHETVSASIVTDRGVLAELTRHRPGIAVTVESTRYVRYDNPDNFRVIKPVRFAPNSSFVWIWEHQMQKAEMAYVEMLRHGAAPQEARGVLPLSFATSLRLTCNIRAWRYILRLRTSPAAHPNMQELMLKTLTLLNQKYPVLFGDIAQLNQAG